MLQHIVLQGDVDLRELAFVVGDTLRTLIPSGVPRFLPLGVRMPSDDRETRGFWSVPDHAMAVRLVRDGEMGTIFCSVDTIDDLYRETIVQALTKALPSVTVDVILANEARFQEMPELVLLVALATRHAPTEKAIEVAENGLRSSSPDLLTLAATSAMLLGGERLQTALEAAAERAPTEPVQNIVRAALLDMPKVQADANRLAPFLDAEDALRVRW